MTRPKGCEHLTDEQIEQLEAVGRATGSPDLVAKVCARGARDTAGLEAAGVNYKDRKPQTFAQQFLAAATPQATKIVPTPAKPVLPGKIEAAIAAANAGGPDLKGFAAQTKIGRKANEKPVSDRNEALAQAVARELGPQVQAIRDFITGVDGARQSIAAQLTDIGHRLDILEGKNPEGAKALLFPGGNGKGKPFPWSSFADTFSGRA